MSYVKSRKQSSKAQYWCVYVIYCPRTNYLYAGFTNSLKRRLKQHRNGRCPSTKYHRPFILLLAEYFLSKSDAMRREAFLRTDRGNSSLWMHLAEGIQLARTVTQRLEQKLS